MPTHTAERAAEIVEQFIRVRFTVPPEDQIFSRTIHLWDGGYVDSIGIAEMIAFLEETFGVRISNEVVFSEDFTHIDGIARLISNLQSGSSSDNFSPNVQISSTL
jgi:acyl carrier protein